MTALEMGLNQWHRLGGRNRTGEKSGKETWNKTSKRNVFEMPESLYSGK